MTRIASSSSSLLSLRVDSGRKKNQKNQKTGAALFWSEAWSATASSLSLSQHSLANGCVLNVDSYSHLFLPWNDRRTSY